MGTRPRVARKHRGQGYVMVRSCIGAYVLSVPGAGLAKLICTFGHIGLGLSVSKLTILADFRLDLTDYFEKNESDRKSSRIIFFAEF